MNLVKNGTFLYGMDHWRSDIPNPESIFYEPGVGNPSPGCVILPEGEMFWQKIEKVSKGKFKVRFQARGVDDDQEFVAIEVQFLDDIFQAEQATVLPFGVGGFNLRRWINYSATVELPDIAPVYLVFQSVEADGPLYIDSIELEPLPEELCPGLVYELQKRRRDFNAVKHPEERYREVVTQAVNGSPASLWETAYLDIEAEQGQYWYQLESVVKKPEHVKRILIHRVVGTDTEEETIGRWTTEFGQDNHVYLHLDEAIYDGCVLRVEYAEYPDFPACAYATTLSVDREWVLCHATTLLLMEADPSLESPEFIDRDLQYWDAKRVAREAEIAPRPRSAKARTLSYETYQKKEVPCGDAADITGGPTEVPVAPTIPLPPVADFYAEEESSSFVPFDVQFRDDSAGGIVGWAWSFGDGVRSNAENPTHQYIEGGFYTVRLTVTDNHGQVNTIEKVDYINVGIPNADFMANPVSDYEPGAIVFTDLSDGIITSYTWDFGDGDASAQSDPQHLYWDPGLYTVTLVVTGPTGKSTKERPDYISILELPPPAPVTDFHAVETESDSAPFEVTFVDDSTGAASWAWSFGDGETSAEQNPKHTYASAGVYTVSLTATNTESVSDTEEKVGYIKIGVPKACFTAVPVELKATEAVAFNDCSTGVITSFSWTFGDGNTSTLQHPVHTYSTEGIYTVTLSVSGPAGSDPLTRPDYIFVDPPPAGPLDCSFYAIQAETYQVPYTVSFKDESQGSIDEWLWDFGDTGGSPLQHPTHQYTAAGIYTVKLTVTDTDDKTDFMERTGYIFIGKPIAEFTASPLNGATPLDVTFDSTTSLGDIDTYAWDFGDEGESALPNPVHQYTEAGYYTVKLTVDGDAGPNTRTRERYIHAGPDSTAPICDFHAEPEKTSDMPATIRFFDDSEGSITVWDWDFGDTGSSAQENPEHQYTAAGQYTVKLTVEDGYGRESTKEIVNYVKIGFPEASFTAGPREGTRPHEVTFVNNSKGVIDSYLWNFGDGDTSEEEEPIHTYTVAGLYTVALTAYGPSGSDTDRKPDYITVNDPPIPEPVAAFSGTPETGNEVPMDVQFVDESTGSIEGWHWTFGDEHWSTQQNIKYTYQEAGIYTVRLTVTDVLDRTDYEEKTEYIKVGVPVSDFVASTITPDTEEPVHLTAKTQGVVTSYAWDFGDGETSAESNPIHIYETADTYSVSLTVTGPAGEDLETKTDYITVSQAPAPLATADFRSSVRESSKKLPTFIQFTYMGQNAVSWSWNFGDGSTLSSEENPNHEYHDVDIFTVTLTVKNADEVEAVETKEDWIKTGVPDANFDTPDLIGHAPHQVTFRCGTAGAIDDYLWDFGDGDFSTEYEPTHVYQTAGLYTVKLTASGPTGSDTKTRTDYILVHSPRPPVQAAFRASPLGDPGVPLDVTFTDESTGSDLQAWLWNFGDGDTSVEQNPVHTYTTGGRFTVIMRVDDVYGETDTVTKEDLIVIGEVTADFDGGPREGIPTLAVGFENLTTGIADSWLWDFGDETTSDEFEPVHDYDTPGDYDVTLTAYGVVNEGGVTVTKTAFIQVDPHPVPVADFLPETSNISQGRTQVNFINESTGATSYLWDFDFVHNPGVHTSTEVSPIYVFENDTEEIIVFSVKLVATGPGGEDNETHELSLYPWEPANAQFDATVTIGPAPLEVLFLNTSTYAESYEWDFDWIGNPGEHTSTDVHHTHIYDTPGDYWVKLVAHPPGEGDSDTLIREEPNGFIHVTGDPPTERVTDCLQVEYHFDENTGRTIHDKSNVGTPLNLAISDLSKVTWSADDYLTVDDSVLIVSNGAATKVIDACQGSNELTMEAWVTRGPMVEDSLFHIIMGIQSPDTAWWRNCAMGEETDSDGMVTRIHTGGGEVGDEQGPAGTLKNGLIHLVATRESDGTVTMYQDAQKINTPAGDAGTFAGWHSDYKLALANPAAELGGAPWLGSLHLVAMYSKALSLAEVQQNFVHGGGSITPPPPPITDVDFYVSSSVSGWGTIEGDDDNDGSETAPWRTLQVAIDRLNAGDTLGVLGLFEEQIVFGAGTKGTLNNRIRIVGINSPQGDHQACIDGQYSKPSGVWAGPADNPHQCPTTSGDAGKFTYSQLIRMKDGGNYVTLENLEVTRSRGRGMGFVERTGIIVKSCYVHDTRAGPIWFEGGENLLVESTKVFHGMDYCTIQRVAQSGGPSEPNAPWAHALLAHGAKNITWRSCIADTCYSEGMGMAHCDNGNIVNCTSRDNNNTGISMNAPVDSKITHCFVSYCDKIKPAAGISVDGEAGRVTGMKRDANNVLVANNIIYGASPGIRFQHHTNKDYPMKWGIKNVSLYHNTIVHVRPPKLNPTKFPGGVSFRIGGNDQANNFGYENINIRNNLVLGTGEGEGSYTLAQRGAMQMAWMGAVSQDSYDSITFSHNWWSYPPSMSKATSPQDKIGSPTTGVVETDLSPTREPEAAHVKDNCTAVGAGMNLRDITVRPVEDDYWETKRPTNPTMGAHEPTNE